MMLAIEAATKLSGKTAHFAMAGWFPGGKADEKLYREAAAVCAPNVHFHIIDGNNKSKLSQAWAAADIFISLVDNIQETFGITPIEAMASGKPVITTPVGGVSDFIENHRNGVICEPNLTIFAGEVGRLLIDSTFRDALGKEAQRSVKDLFDYRRLVTDMEGLYKELLNKT
jgi:glycosyltransferase involved in cell wall biosynthesis